MIASLKSEFRKFLTIRSTYVISILALLLLGFIAFYAMGYKGAEEPASLSVYQASQNMIMLISAFTGIAAILHICHEYRYNTIAYTLTMTNRRLKVLASKLTVIAVYGVIMSGLALLLTAILLPLGAKMAGTDFPPQTDYDAYNLIWRTLVYITLGNWMALLFGFLFRSLVFSIAAWFIIPSTIEPLINGLLKVSSNYLPNMAHNQIMMVSSDPAVNSPLASAGVVLLYLVGGWIIAATLFVKRDAN